MRVCGQPGKKKNTKTSMDNPEHKENPTMMEHRKDTGELTHKDYEARHQKNEQREHQRAEWRERMSRQAHQGPAPEEVSP